MNFGHNALKQESPSFMEGSSQRIISLNLAFDSAILIVSGVFSSMIGLSLLSSMLKKTDQYSNSEAGNSRTSNTGRCSVWQIRLMSSINPFLRTSFFFPVMSSASRRFYQTHQGSFPNEQRLKRNKYYLEFF